jgi:NAD(P)-dependent dehydrogenase (short-subunit alcohol dehydrogenase family)
MAHHHASGRAVLVTGTSTGIGRATALRLDELGFRVFAGVRREEDGENLKRMSSSRLTPINIDVTDQESIETARQRVEEELVGHGLAGLINNAGLGIGGPMEFVPTDQIRKMFDVNYFGAIDVTKAFLPAIRKARGRIVNVSSIATLHTVPLHGPYSSSKLALNGFSEALRLEVYRQGIEVSVIICGCVKTPIWEKTRSEYELLEDDYPPAYHKLYGSTYRKVKEFFAKIARDGVTPESAAAIISRAITESRPKNTYYVGRDAYMNLVMSRLFHGKRADWMMLRAIGI